MNKEEILKTIKSLAMSQGFYCRMLKNLTDEYLEYLEEQNFSSPLDIVLFLEE